MRQSYTAIFTDRGDVTVINQLVDPKVRRRGGRGDALPECLGCGNCTALMWGVYCLVFVGLCTVDDRFPLRTSRLDDDSGSYVS